MNYLPFYVLRRPLLSIQTYFTLQEKLRQGVELSDCLAEFYRQPLALAALYYASPEIHRQCQSWLTGTLEPSGKLLKTLYKYAVRMATRATPFGMFSGISVGNWDEKTNVEFEKQVPIRICTRLDASVLAQLLHKVSNLASVRHHVQYRANTTVYSVGADLRFIEANREGPIPDGYALSITSNTHYLQRILEVSRTGATFGDLIELLTQEAISVQEAADFLHHLVDSQLLLSEFEPTLTGPDSLTRLIERLETIPDQEVTLTTLRDIQVNLINALPDDCLTLQKQLEALAGPVELPFVQCDSYFPTAQNAISLTVRNALQETLNRLLRLRRPSTPSFLEEFKRRFYERYEEQEVPLLIALDPDVGIGYGDSSVFSVLLDGLTWPDTDNKSQPFTPQHQVMLRLYTEAMRQGQETPLITLSEADLGALIDGQDDPVVPASGYWIGQLLAESAAAVDAGEWLFHLTASGGPSAGNLLGRMAHLDPELEQALQDALRQEEESDSDSIWAELVHLPQPKIANVLRRPVLRPYEIPILTPSSVPDDHQITLDDLWVSAPKGGRIVLRSKRLGKRVIPRLSTAHNYTQGLAHYRFLCDLQTQDGGLQVGWDWGPLASLPQLPQVRYRNIILSRASWRLSYADWPSTTTDWIAGWRVTYKVPQYVVLTEVDNELPLDLDTPLSRSFLSEELRKRGSIQIKEWLVSKKTCWAGNQANSWISELILPVSFPVKSTGSVPKSTWEPNLVQRSFPPSSEWLYLKIFSGEQATEQLLTTEIPALINNLRANELLKQWFFVRFNRPEPHVRVRFQSQPEQASALFMQVTAWIQQLTADYGSVYQFQIDTYHREVERYGANRIENCEAWFCQESDILLPVLQEISEQDESRRLYYACALTNRMFEQWQVPLPERKQLINVCRDSFSREFQADTQLLVQLDKQYRHYRLLVHDALTNFVVMPEISQYDKRVDNLITQLRTTIANKQELNELLVPLLHMLLNRLFPTENRRHEYLVYHLLTKEYTSLLKRNQITVV
jgi:thiopeptide-type bacteriocin biosynthesis protein